MELRFNEIKTRFSFKASASYFIPLVSFPPFVRLFISRFNTLRVRFTNKQLPKAFVAPASKLLPANSKCSIPLFYSKLLAIKHAFSSDIYFRHIFKCFNTVLSSQLCIRILTWAARSLRPEIVYSGLLIFYKASLTITPKTPFFKN